MIFRKPVFQLWSEVPDKTLNWPGSAVSQSADGVALNLFAQFPNHINLLWLCVAFSEPPHHCVHPVNALSAWSALAARLVLIEHCKPCNCLDHICLFVHHNDSCCAKTSLLCHQVVKVHQNFVTNPFGDEGSRAAVPRPVCFATRSSKSIKTSSQTPLGMRGVELPPGITQSRLSQPPMTSPQCLCISSFRGMLISSSTVQGLFTWPEMLKSLEPELRVRPMPANQSPPLLQMVGATATVSTLVTVVGQPKTPTSAGNGGFRRGFPCFPSRLSIKAVSSPQM